MLAWLAWIGCSGGPLPFDGIPTRDLFPFDCDVRHSEYISEDTSVPYKLVADVIPEPEKDAEGDNVYTIVYSKLCLSSGADCTTGDVIRKVQMSSPIGDGVTIHGYAEGAGAIVPLEPPVALTLPKMAKGDAVETTAGGLTWTGELVTIDECPVRLTADWDECYQFDLTARPADSEPPTADAPPSTLGAPIAGSWWAIAGPGIVALDLVGETGRWELSSTSDEIDGCDGEW